MSPRVYRPDHTAHVRRRLTQTAAYGTFGLVIAAAAAGSFAVVGSRVPTAWTALVSANWILDAVAAGVAVLCLLVTLVAWLVYRRRRPDLDAARAEIVGELHARIANLHRDDTD
jgi:uncharacterized membrane protein YdbT with pleckstrin-like domain